MNKLQQALTERMAGKTFLLALAFFALSPAAQPLAHCQDQPSQQPAVITINDLFAEIGRRVPAFGGMFVDEDKDTLYVYMVPGQPGDAGTLDQAITEVLGPGRPPEHHLEMLEGQYTFRQLKNWHDRMSARLLAMPGVLSTGIYDARNRLQVEVEASEVAPRVQAEVAVLGISGEAVIIQEAAAGEFEDSSFDLPPATLRDRWRPLVGGLQIQDTEEGLSRAHTCTLGFIATRNRVLGFVTNSHCIFNQEVPSDSIFYQPTVNRDNRVGLGDVDPPFFDKQQNDKCPERKICRFSDSAFVKLDNGVEATRGAIAQPPPGSDTWDGRATFRIVGKAMSVSRETVTRVSSQSGRSQGRIIGVCQNRGVTGVTNVIYLCQTVVSWDREVVAGDSGSPVFTTGRDTNDVNLLGILRSSTDVSPIQNIEITDELGPTLLVCASGVEC
jgi:hypothetical protein